MHTNGTSVNDALTHLCVLRALRKEEFDWYTTLTTTDKSKRSDSNYFFSYDGLHGNVVIGLCVVDNPVVRHTAKLLGLDEYIWFGHNSDPINTHTIAEFYTLLTQRRELVWFSQP